MDNSIIKLLGEGRTNEIKDVIKNIIINNITEDLSSECLISMNDFRCMGDEILQEIKEEVKEEVKKRVKDTIAKSMEEKILKSLSFD